MPRKRRPSEQVPAELYEELLAAQGGHCALCENTPKSRRLHFDHDHQTGKVRGLLCFRCNRALPHYLDAAWLRRAAVYVGLNGDGRDYLAVSDLPEVEYR